MRTLVLFDIDGTLILTGGAGIRALSRAFEETFAVADGFDGIPVAGRTDPVIIGDAKARAGVDATSGALDEFRRRYVDLLRIEIERPGARKGVMPGVRELLETLTASEEASVALLTGNFREAAQIKLEHFLLWHYFDWGVFGDEALDRNRLMPIAMERARHRGIAPIEPRNVFVVGDTPFDIACAAVVGARAIAVATGGYDTVALRAAGASVVFDDLTDTSRFLRLLDADRSSAA